MIDISPNASARNSKYDIPSLLNDNMSISADNRAVTIRANLLTMGYSPLDVWNCDQPVNSPGKQPVGNAWQEVARRRQPSAFDRRATNTGILCDGLRAVDIDVDSPDECAQIIKLACDMLDVDLFAPAPCRGRSNTGRVLFVFRAAEGQPEKRTIKGTLLNDNGTPAGVEVLGRGQQFVAYGRHPSGVNYEWTVPLVPLRQLPTVTEEEIGAFLTAARAIFGERGQKSAAKRDNGDNRRDTVWARINSAALKDLDAWVPDILPDAKKQRGGKGWRMTSKGLGRDLQEDLTFHPNGIQDFGEEHGMTAIDVVTKWGDADGVKEAALWLCERLGLDFNKEDDAAKLADYTNDFDNFNDDLPATGGDDWVIDAFDSKGEPDLSDDQLALALGKAGWNRNARYVAKLGGWLLWDGSRWRAAESMRHMTIIRGFLRNTANNLNDWAKKKDDEDAYSFAKRESKNLRSDAKRAALERMLQSNKAALAEVLHFDQGLHLLGTPDGTVDLTTGEMRAPDRADYITRQTTVAPSAEGAGPEIWLRFLDRIFAGDGELIELMQRLAGYSLTGHTTENKFFFCHGGGRNGKSTFLTTMQKLMGDYARSVPSSVFLDTKHGEQHSTGVAGLRGARLAVGSELPAGKTWNEEIIKSLTGDDMITARLMRQDFFDFYPQCTIIVPGNKKPRFKGVDEALRARVVLIPFTVTIPEAERDKHFADKLKPEWPEILRWALDGAVKWYRDGLRIPASVKAASREYMDSEDHIAHFLEDETIADPEARVEAASMYERFKKWQEEQGAHLKWSQRATTSALQERGLDYYVGNGFRGFRGIRLRSPFDGDLLV